MKFLRNFMGFAMIQIIVKQQTHGSFYILNNYRFHGTLAAVSTRPSQHEDLSTQS